MLSRSDIQFYLLGYLDIPLFADLQMGVTARHTKKPPGPTGRHRPARSGGYPSRMRHAVPGAPLTQGAKWARLCRADLLVFDSLEVTGLSSVTFRI